MANQPIPCPICGSPMNHHADKLVYQDERQDIDELLEEFHRCPTCGTGVSRTAIFPGERRL